MASVGSYSPGPTCVPVRSVGSGNVIGRDLGDFAAGRACSERSRRRSVLRGRLTAARPSRDTVPLPPTISVSAPFAGLSEARYRLRGTTDRATLIVVPSFDTRSSPPYRSLRSRLRKGTPRYRSVDLLTRVGSFRLNVELGTEAVSERSRPRVRSAGLERPLFPELRCR